MWGSIAWALCFLVVMLVAIWRIEKNVNAQLSLKRDEFAAEQADLEVTRLERKNAAELAEASKDERAEFERAHLKRQAAEEQAAAEVAAATIPEQIEEKRKIIAARAEGRAEAARQEGLQSVIPDTTGIQEVMEAYKVYCQHTGIPDSLDEWLGSVSVENGRLSVNYN